MGTRSALLLTGARVLAADGRWHSACAIADGRFVGVGSRTALRASLTSRGWRVEEFRLARGWLVPSFLDGHIHPLFGAIFQESGIQLRDSAGKYYDSPQQVITAVRQWAANHRRPAGSWITGYGWDPALARDPGFRRQLLDEAGGGRPIYLLSLDAHFALVSTAGLEKLGTIVFPPGSGLEPKQADGSPSGLLLETPQFIASLRVLAQMPYGPNAAAFETFQERELVSGVTAINDILGDGETLRFYLRLYAERRLRIRVIVSPYGPMEERERMRALLDEACTNLPGERERRQLRDFIGIGPDKYLLDGTPGNHNAAWFQAYADDPTTSGYLTISPDQLTGVIARAEADRVPLALHAAGDLSVHEALDALHAAKGGMRDRPKAMVRIEHFDNVTAQDRARLRSFGRKRLLASIQPTHFAEVYVKRIREVIGPERLRLEYPLRTLIAAGIPVALNSDWPAALTFNPLEMLRAAEQHGAESLSPAEAFHAITAGNALAVGWEKKLGAIRPGALADAVLLNGNPLLEPAERLLVLQTWIHGVPLGSAGQQIGAKR